MYQCFSLRIESSASDSKLGIKVNVDGFLMENVGVLSQLYSTSRNHSLTNQ